MVRPRARSPGTRMSEFLKAQTNLAPAKTRRAPYQVQVCIGRTSVLPTLAGHKISIALFPVYQRVLSGSIDLSSVRYLPPAWSLHRLNYLLVDTLSCF